MNFAERLKEIRKSQNLSQEQLAEKIGVSRQAITKWETGRGLPDIDNMKILAEIFKMTIDDLVSSETIVKDKPKVNISETIYDIDMSKHFDIEVGTANTINITHGDDEKFHIILESSEIENIGSVFKVSLDENKNKLDVNCTRKDKISRYEAEDHLTVTILLPSIFTDKCEIAADVKYLNLNNLTLRRLEYDGKANYVDIKNCTGKIELTGKTDYDITVDRVNGKLDINQWNAKSVLRIPESVKPVVVNKGRFCKVYGLEASKTKEEENVVSISGIKSELKIELL